MIARQLFGEPQPLPGCQLRLYKGTRAGAGPTAGAAAVFTPASPGLEAWLMVVLVLAVLPTTLTTAGARRSWQMRTRVPLINIQWIGSHVRGGCIKRPKQGVMQADALFPFSLVSSARQAQPQARAAANGTAPC